MIAAAAAALARGVLRNGRVAGPLALLGYSLGYYGHQDWWPTMSWSLGSSP